MLYAKILPQFLKELIKNVPELAFEITDWGSVMRDLPVVSSRYFTGSGVDELVADHHKEFAPFNLTSTQTYLPSSPKGDLLLRYYFAQLYSKSGVFFDLRTSHFDITEMTLKFNPNGLWYPFSEKFRLALISIYEGFYCDKREKFLEGLRNAGLLPTSFTEAQSDELEQLFRNHFGPNLDAKMKFSLEQFQVSFLAIFKFLLKHKVTLSSEFLIFGIYLVTLYLSLEEWGQEHDVRAQFLNIQEKLR